MRQCFPFLLVRWSECPALGTTRQLQQLAYCAKAVAAVVDAVGYHIAFEPGYNTMLICFRYGRWPHPSIDRSSFRARRC